jgi:phosphatidylglycerol---prolipoprotein diacylglyceryl transferase
MHPILFYIGDFPIYTFGLLVGSAFLAGTWLAMSRAKAWGYNPDIILAAACWVIGAGIIGARLFYVVFFPQLFLQNPIGSLFSRGGLVWYGGMISVIVTMGILAKVNRIPILRFLDIWSMPAALGLAIGRLGCLMAGCCYGAPCELPWAIQYPIGHETYPHHVHPSPLYETAALFILMALMGQYEKRHVHSTDKTGMSAVWFLVGYGIIRFMGEYLRGDRLVWITQLNLSASQVISLGGILAGLLLWGSIHLMSKRHDTKVA